MGLTNDELKKMMSFLIETFEFTEEQTAAIDHQIPMTQEMFDSIVDRCAELGSCTENLFFRMMDEYPEFVEIQAKRIEEELRK